MIKKLCVKCKVNLKNKLQIGNCQNVVFCTKLLSVVYHLVQNLHPLRQPFLATIPRAFDIWNFWFTRNSYWGPGPKPDEVRNSRWSIAITLKTYKYTTEISSVAFTTQLNTLKRLWGMGALVSQAQDMFNWHNTVSANWVRDTSNNILHAPEPDT